jgi:uncharacterized protein YjbI with pentapeptide repeats
MFASRLFKTAFLLTLIYLTTACTGFGFSFNYTGVESGDLLSGTVSAGPVRNSKIKIYALNSNGSLGDEIGSAVTDGQGKYKIKINKKHSGPSLIVASGGSYEEEASAETIDLGSAQIRTALPSISKDQEIGITPVTEIATQNAIAQAQANASIDLAEVIDASNKQIATAMGVDDITEPPSDPNSNAKKAKTASAAKYSVVLGAISQMSSAASISGGARVNSLDVAQALATSFIYNGGKFEGTANVSGGQADVHVSTSTGATVKLKDVFQAAGGGGASFARAMEDATNSHLDECRRKDLDYEDSSLVPVPSFVSEPPRPPRAPVLVAPPPPVILPVIKPRSDGPPKLPPPPKVDVNTDNMACNPGMGLSLAGKDSCIVENGGSPGAKICNASGTGYTLCGVGYCEDGYERDILENLGTYKGSSRSVKYQGACVPEGTALNPADRPADSVSAPADLDNTPCEPGMGVETSASCNVANGGAPGAKICNANGTGYNLCGVAYCQQGYVRKQVEQLGTYQGQARSVLYPGNCAPAGGVSQPPTTTTTTLPPTTTTTTLPPTTTTTTLPPVTTTTTLPAQSCIPGDTNMVSCSMPNGVGKQLCNPEGTGFSLCFAQSCNAGFRMASFSATRLTDINPTRSYAGACVPDTALPMIAAPVFNPLLPSLMISSPAGYISAPQAGVPNSNMGNCQRLMFQNCMMGMSSPAGLVSGDGSQLCFSGADLRGAIITANLDGAYFANSNLTGAKFYGNVKNSCFTNANLTNVTFNPAQMSVREIINNEFMGANMKAVSFLKTSVRHNDFWSAFIQGANFVNSSVGYNNLSSNLFASNFQYSSIDNNYFSGSNLEGSTINRSVVGYNFFGGGRFLGGGLDRSIIHNNAFHSFIWQGVVVNQMQVSENSFTNSQWTNVNLLQSIIENNNFVNSSLQSVDVDPGSFVNGNSGVSFPAP